MLQTQTVSDSTFSLLKQLQGLPELDGMTLAGGTALALQVGHRISVDLDFFGELMSSHEGILSAFNEIGNVQILNRSKSILSVSLNKVKVDVVDYHYPLIRNHVSEGEIKLHSLEDIGAMKLAAITGRGRKRDFYDLYFLLRKFSLEELLGFYSEKYPDGNQFLVMKSITYFEDADQDADPVLINNRITWDQVKKKILGQIR